MKKFYIIFLTFLFIFMATTFNKVSGSMFKRTIAIDLDGVLDEYDGKYNKTLVEIKRFEKYKLM